ncbi:MAG: hypothetical protein AAF433_10980 [Bacteroidota bacterium]
MAQFSWTVHGNRANTYQIGLFHGDNDQHVVLHCNAQVISIDFSVKEAKTYSLYVDDLLCEVTIEPDGKGGFNYDCQINHEAPTPLNQKRKAEAAAAEKDGKLRLIVAVGFVILVASLLILAS